MPDFDDRDYEFNGEIPPPMMGFGSPGFELYHSGAHFGPSVGTEKNKDESDEKVKLENIREIPKYDVIKRFKAWRTYRKYYTGYNRIKEEMYWNMAKLNRIDSKLQKYENYPDDVINRDKLVKERNKLHNKLLSAQKELTEVGRIKIQSYAKALGYAILPDEAFDILGPLGNNNKSTKEKVVKKEVNNDSTTKAKKEEKTNVNSSDVKVNATKPNKSKHHRSNTRKNKSSLEIQNGTYDTNTEKLLKLYNLLVNKYGSEDAKKYLENFIEQESKKNNVDELSEMLDSARGDESKGSVRK